MAEHLIRQGKAYVDDTPADAMRAQRGTLTEPGQNSPSRYRRSRKTWACSAHARRGISQWGAGGSREDRYGLGQYESARSGAVPDFAFDPSAHRRCVVHLSDVRLRTWAVRCNRGITHSICTLEFEDHRPLYDWLIDNLPVPARPRQYEFARLNIGYTVLSKRILTKLVTEKHVSGWDDPRMPTLAGIRRRGVPAAALREFVRRVGVARAFSVVDAAMLDSSIRDTLNPVAPRRMAVLQPLKLIIENYPEGVTETLER